MNEQYPIWIGENLIEALRKKGWLEASVPRPVKRAHPEARPSMLNTIVAYIAAHPNMTTFEIGAAFNLKHRTILTYLERLHREGSIAKKSGRPNLWWVEEGD